MEYGPKVLVDLDQLFLQLESGLPRVRYQELQEPLRLRLHLHELNLEGYVRFRCNCD